MSWSRRRPNSVRRLCIDDDDDVERDITVLPAAVTGAVFCSQSSSLVKLRLLAVDVGINGRRFEALAVLTRLASLEVRTESSLHVHVFKVATVKLHVVTQDRLAVRFCLL